MQPKIFSFFSGVGFLDLGFDMSGYSIVFANEFRKPFLDGYKHARRILGIAQPIYGHSTDSITQFTESDIRNKWLAEKVAEAKLSGEPVGFIGGPPCPDFSVGGKNRGKHGENGKLSATYIDLICQQRPDFFLFENVKGLWRTKRHREFFDELKRKLHNAGYCTTEKLVNCIQYGVAQDRERIILIGFLRRSESEPKELPDGMFQWKRYQKYTAAEISKLPWPSTDKFAQGKVRHAPEGIPEDLTVEHWFRCNSVDTHKNARHRFKPRAGLARFRTVPEGDDSKKSFKRLHRWRYSPTACYGNNEVHLHPYDARRISVAEALSIQSLPRDFELPDSMSLSDMFKTVGNGVPYLAARAFAKTVMEFLKDHYDRDGFQLVAGDQPAPSQPRLQLH